jgi:hypothetical protein
MRLKIELISVKFKGFKTKFTFSLSLNSYSCQADKKTSAYAEFTAYSIATLEKPKFGPLHELR